LEPVAVEALQEGDKIHYRRDHAKSLRTLVKSLGSALRGSSGLLADLYEHWLPPVRGRVPTRASARRRPLLEGVGYRSSEGQSSVERGGEGDRSRVPHWLVHADTAAQGGTLPDRDAGLNGRGPVQRLARRHLLHSTGDHASVVCEHLVCE